VGGVRFLWGSLRVEVDLKEKTYGKKKQGQDPLLGVRRFERKDIQF